MSTSLRQRLDGLTASFASDVLGAIRAASLQDLLGAPSGGARAVVRRAPTSGGTARRRDNRLPRRSPNEIARAVESIVGLLRQNPKGLRAEQIRQKLGLQAKELPRPLNEALESGRLAKSGQKRATTYYVKGAASKPAVGKPTRAAPAARRGRTSGKASAKSAKAAKAIEKNEKRAAPPGTVDEADAQA